MLYLATPSSPAAIAEMTRGALGCMTSPRQGNRVPPRATWAADNGRFGRGWPGERAWIRWLAGQAAGRTGTCRFAVAPDQPLDAAATLAESTPWLSRIRALGLPAAYAAQDGSEQPGMVPWAELDVLFLGGSTAWKTGPEARALSQQAISLGKKVHMGRVNSQTRLRLARDFGATSADGTYLKHGPDRNLPILQKWLAGL